jgi:hypothetical protein
VTKLQDFRKAHPQYDDLSDDALAGAMHKKFYADLPREDFDRQIGLPQKGVVSRGVTAVGNVVSNVAKTVKGKQDPAFADVPAYIPETPDLARGQAQAKMVTFGDESYADILKSQLGENFVRMDRDANDYPVLVYKDREGQERKGYVNKPGLDWQDVDRLLSQAVPFVLGGSLGSGFSKALGLGKVGTATGVGLGTGAASVGADVAAAGMGSEQGVDIARAGLATGLGALSQVVPPTALATGVGAVMGTEAGDTVEEKIAGGVMGAATGGLAAKFISSVASKPGERHLSDGKLSSQEARVAAQKAGLNPDEMTPEDAAMFARGFDIATDPSEVASGMQTGKFGIPSTKGQRTKDPELLAVEKGVRSGQMGQQAKERLADFDLDQRRQLTQSALTRPDGGKTGDPFKEGMGAMIAPTRGVYSPEQAAPGALGRSISEGVQTAKSAGDKVISQAWKGLDDVMPKPEAFKELPNALQNRIGELPIDEVLTPAATRMVRELDDFVSGTLPEPQSALLGQPKAFGLDQMRRRLMSMKDGADNATDRAAAKAIYHAFDDWMDDIATKGFVAGRPEVVARLRTARRITREVKELFSPRDELGRQSAAGRILEKIADDDATPESVVSDLLGGGGATTTPKIGSIPALNRIKSALFGSEKGKVGPLVDRATAARTWNDIRMAYWSRLVINKKGAMETPTMTAQNINSAFRNQESLMRTLFTKDELKVMREYQKAVDEVAYKDPNPAGTATTIMALLKNPSKEAVRTFFRVKAQRETFSKHNFMMARFYQLLAKHVPNVFGTKESIGAGLARKAVSQDLTRKAPPSRGFLGGVSAGTIMDGYRFKGGDPSEQGNWEPAQ